MDDGYEEDYIAAAWLHDVLEDTSWTSNGLIEAGIPSCVVEAVEVLTKTEDVSYLDYILSVNADSIARVVKAYDIQDNMNDWPKGKKKNSMYQKYELALYILHNIDI
jgi:(p)ppGpp synthase/HD superfamily hydrolase